MIFGSVFFMASKHFLGHFEHGPVHSQFSRANVAFVNRDASVLQFLNNFMIYETEFVLAFK